MGGHEITYDASLAKPWQCRVCRRTAGRRTTLSFSRCPGSAIKRWAQSAAVSCTLAGGGHHLLRTGNVTWCWKCGANACARAHHLARPCPGTCRGFLVQARQRLLLGLHPSSRVPLAAETVPESGQLMPAGFSQARRAAEASKTAAACHRPHVRHSGLSQRALIESPRLVALRARVVAKEAAAKGRLLATPVVQKRRRLRGKQPGR